MISIASFDIFDTLLTRAVGSPESLFLLLGRSLKQQSLIDCSAEAFAHARIDAERRAFQNHGVSCTLVAIHTELATALRFSESQRQTVMQQECMLEAQLIRPVPGAHDRVEKARASGQRVVFLSDMYLPSAFICDQLIHHGLWKVGDQCYVSCEHQANKESGELFARMLSIEGSQPQFTSHQGNSYEGDIRPAAAAGLHVRPFYDANLNRYENLLESASWKTEGLSSMMAGASRQARLNTPTSNGIEQALVNVAAGVLAPTLISYVIWILQRAQQLRLKRLYFLSRDGQILGEIAQRIAPTLQIDCDLRYLYASRQSWNLPAVIKGTDEELSWIWDSPDFLSIRSLLRRVSLEPVQIQPQLSAMGFPKSDWSRALSSKDLTILKHSLLDQSVRTLIVHQAHKKRRILLEYLKQEDVLNDVRWGIVDLGWYGSMQNALVTVLQESQANLPSGFYFALLKGSIVHNTAAYREAFYFDESRGTGYTNSFRDIIALMEMFCVSDHGTVIEFAEQDKQIIPVLKETQNQIVIDWGLPLVRKAIFAFMDHLLPDPKLVNPWADTREAITTLLEEFWYQPTHDEASAWGSFPWEDGLGSETYTKSLACPFHWHDALRSLHKMHVAPHHRAAWLYGSLALSPTPMRLLMSNMMHAFRFYRSLRYRALTRLRSLRN